MFQVLKFVLDSIISFMSMLFSINVDSNLSIGLLICICFIFLPMMLRVIRFIKQDALEELDDKYDEARPRETWSFTENQRLKTGYGKWVSSQHTQSRSRRYKL